MYCERSNTSRDYCANETVQDRGWNCGSDAENVRDVSNTIAGARGGSMSAAPSPQGILSTAPRGAARRWLSRTVAILYGLVMFEVIIMISPFAFYFYAAYGPMLKWLKPLESHRVVDRICASARGVYDQSVSGVSALALGPLRFRLRPRGLLLSGCPDLRLASVSAKSGDVRSLPLYPPSPVPLSEYRCIRTLHHVAAGDHIPIVCGHALCLLLPRPGGGAANANSSSRIRRVHAWHGHVPAGQSRRARLRVAIWRHAQSVARPSTGDWKLGVGAPSDRHWAACVYAGAYLALDRCSEHGSHLGIPDDP